MVCAGGEWEKFLSKDNVESLDSNLHERCIGMQDDELLESSTCS